MERRSFMGRLGLVLAATVAACRDALNPTSWVKGKQDPNTVAQFVYNPLTRTMLPHNAKAEELLRADPAKVQGMATAMTDKLTTDGLMAQTVAQWQTMGGTAAPGVAGAPPVKPYAGGGGLTCEQCIRVSCILDCGAWGCNCCCVAWAFTDRCTCVGYYACDPPCNGTQHFHTCPWC